MYCNFTANNAVSWFGLRNSRHNPMDWINEQINAINKYLLLLKLFSRATKQMNTNEKMTLNAWIINKNVYK